jgi:hypothetical protein
MRASARCTAICYADCCSVSTRQQPLRLAKHVVATWSHAARELPACKAWWLFGAVVAQAHPNRVDPGLFSIPEFVRSARVNKRTEEVLVIRKAVCKALILSLALSVAGVAVMGCSDGGGDSTTEGGRKVGSVGLRLVVAPGVTVNTVNWTIQGPGGTFTGTFDVSGPGTTFTKKIDNIPAGTGYTVKLDAVASDGSIGHGEVSNVTVIARQATGVTITLRFRPPTATTGSVIVNGTTNVCPTIAANVALPLSIPVGGTSQITGTATDYDSAPSALTYAWTVSPAGIGTLSSTTIANPVFTASATGTATLTLVVSDGDTACDDTLAATVTVTAATGGTGGTGGTAGQGTGGTSSGTGGTTEGTGGVSGGTGGTTEGTGGTTEGTGGVSGGTGGTTEGTGGVSGGTGGTTEGTGGTSGGTGGTSGGDACLTCELADHDGSTGCPDAYALGDTLAGNAAAGPAQGTPKSQLFHAIIDCFHSTHCATNATSDCLCGIGANASTCFQAASVDALSGPCKNEIAAGAETTIPSDINSRFYNDTLAIGAATGLSENCDQFVCVDECL